MLSSSFALPVADLTGIVVGWPMPPLDPVKSYALSACWASSMPLISSSALTRKPPAFLITKPMMKDRTNEYASTAPAGVDGLFYGGGLDQLWRQVVGALAVLVFSFVLTLVIGTVIQKTIGFRVSEEEEVMGVDEAEHAETAYDFSSLGGGGGLHAASAARIHEASPAEVTAGARKES